MIITKTPLRASFFGGGSDFSHYFRYGRYGFGEVLSTTVNMYVYITVSRKFDSRIRVCYSQTEIVDDVAELKHNIIREALRMVGISDSVEIIYTADIPLGSAGVGLASSSAIAVGTLHALLAYKGVYATPAQLAAMACQLEIERLGSPIGIQDQYAVAMGGFRRYRFWADGSVSADPVLASQETLARLKASLMLFYTGHMRDSRPIMREQTDTIPQKMELLDSMVEGAEQAYQDLLKGDTDAWGRYLDIAWARKKRFANGVSNPALDEMYGRALVAGAIGGKILGAGGGGFMLLYVPHEAQNHVRHALSEYRLIDFNFEPDGTRLIFAD